MAKGGGRRSRMDLRREAEAVEAREKEVVEGDDEEADDEEADDEEADPDAEPDAESDADEGDADEDAPKPKKKAKKAAVAKVKKPAAKRTRTAKEIRQRAVWVVFDNASKRVETFPYNQKAEAEALLARKLEEKKGTFYLNLVKEKLEE